MRLNIPKIRRLIGRRPQSQIARACGLAQPNLNRCLSGKHAPTLATIEKLAKGLRVKARDLLLALALIAALVALLACGRSDPPPAAPPPSWAPPRSETLRPLLSENPFIALGSSLKDNPLPPSSFALPHPPGNQEWSFGQPRIFSDSHYEAYRPEIRDQVAADDALHSKLIVRLVVTEDPQHLDTDEAFALWQERLRGVIEPKEIAAGRSALELARVDNLKYRYGPSPVPPADSDSGRFQTRARVMGGAPFKICRVTLELYWLDPHAGWLAWKDYQAQPLRIKAQELYGRPVPPPGPSPPPPDPVGIIPPP